MTKITMILMNMLLGFCFGMILVILGSVAVMMKQGMNSVHVLQTGLLLTQDILEILTLLILKKEIHGEV